MEPDMPHAACADQRFTERADETELPVRLIKPLDATMFAQNTPFRAVAVIHIGEQGFFCQHRLVDLMISAAGKICNLLSGNSRSIHNYAKEIINKRFALVRYFEGKALENMASAGEDVQRGGVPGRYPSGCLKQRIIQKWIPRSGNEICRRHASQVRRER